MSLFSVKRTNFKFDCVSLRMIGDETVRLSCSIYRLFANESSNKLPAIVFCFEKWKLGCRPEKRLWIPRKENYGNIIKTLPYSLFQSQSVFTIKLFIRNDQMQKNFREVPKLAWIERWALYLIHVLWIENLKNNLELNWDSKVFDTLFLIFFLKISNLIGYHLLSLT